MRFKEFLQKEAMGSAGGDRGLMGGDPKPLGRKPSDGQPFAKYLSDFAAPQGAGGGAAAPFMAMMKKKMKKK